MVAFSYRPRAVAFIAFFLAASVSTGIPATESTRTCGVPSAASSSLPCEDARESTAQALLQKSSVVTPKVSKPHRVVDDEDDEGDEASMSLSESGYRKVVKLESEREMERFIKRAVDELGYKISDLGSLKGVIPYYSGKKAVQSYAALKQELARVSKKKTGWAKRRCDEDEEEEDEAEEENEEDEKPVRKKKSASEDDEGDIEEEAPKKKAAVEDDVEEEVPKKRKAAVEEENEDEDEEAATPKKTSKLAKRLHSLLEDADQTRTVAKKSALEDDEEVVPAKRARRVREEEEDEALPKRIAAKASISK